MVTSNFIIITTISDEIIEDDVERIFENLFITYTDESDSDTEYSDYADFSDSDFSDFSDCGSDFIYFYNVFGF